MIHISWIQKGLIFIYMKRFFILPCHTVALFASQNELTPAKTRSRFLRRRFLWLITLASFLIIIKHLAFHSASAVVPCSRTRSLSRALFNFLLWDGNEKCHILLIFLKLTRFLFRFSSSTSHQTARPYFLSDDEKKKVFIAVDRTIYHCYVNVLFIAFCCFPML